MSVTIWSALLVVWAAMFGACIGSFLNVVVYRVPRGMSVVSPPSACPNCGTQIAWFDNIPVVSWVALMGKCRSCKVSISPSYAVMEAVAATYFGAAAAIIVYAHGRELVIYESCLALVVFATALLFPVVRGALTRRRDERDVAAVLARQQGEELTAGSLLDQ